MAAMHRAFHRFLVPTLCTVTLACVGLGVASQSLAADGDKADDKPSLLEQGSSLLDRFSGKADDASSDNGENTGDVSETDITAAFREALQLGSTAVIAQLGQENGYLDDEVAHIVLPKSLRKVKKTLGKFGLDGVMDDLEVSLNRAAETATPLAKDLFVQAVDDMSFQDVVEIYQGDDDAATQYFRGQMSDPLKTAMRPLVESSLSEVGAIQLYDQAIEQYEDLPLVPKVKGDLTEHVLDASLDGIFHYLALQEQAIRQDPLKQTTSLLKKVFGG